MSHPSLAELLSPSDPPLYLSLKKKSMTLNVRKTLKHSHNISDRRLKCKFMNVVQKEIDHLTHLDVDI